MGSSGGGPGDPRFLSQGGTPIPGLPIAGQGAANDTPQNFGKFQEFLPTVQAPGGTAGGYTIPSNAETRAAPSATGLKSEMFQYRSPQGAIMPIGGAGGGGGGASSSDVSAMRQQLAALQAQAGNGQFGAAGQQQGFGMFNQPSASGYPQNWLNSNNPNATS
jgi:hypothetical protein